MIQRHRCSRSAGGTEELLGRLPSLGRVLVTRQRPHGHEEIYTMRELRWHAIYERRGRLYMSEMIQEVSWALLTISVLHSAQFAV